MQPDTIIPDLSNPQSWNRFSYVGNRPVNFTDPTGHMMTTDDKDSGGCAEKLKKPKNSDPQCPKGTKDRRDLTDWLARALVDSSKNPVIKLIAKENHNGGITNTTNALGQFYAMVHNGAYFDVKANVEKEVGRYVQLGNDWYEFSTTGNILYGFYGAASNFTPDVLYRGAGLAQHIDYVEHRLGISAHQDWPANLGPSGSPFYGDTSDDHYGVQFGIDLYKQYQKTGSLTAQELTLALDLYKYKSEMIPFGAPSNCLPANGEYPTDAFYNTGY